MQPENVRPLPVPVLAWAQYGGFHSHGVSPKWMDGLFHGKSHPQKWRTGSNSPYRKTPHESMCAFPISELDLNKNGVFKDKAVEGFNDSTDQTWFWNQKNMRIQELWLCGFPTEFYIRVGSTHVNTIYCRGWSAIFVPWPIDMWTTRNSNGLSSYFPHYLVAITEDIPSGYFT